MASILHRGLVGRLKPGVQAAGSSSHESVVIPFGDAGPCAGPKGEGSEGGEAQGSSIISVLWLQFVRPLISCGRPGRGPRLARPPHTPFPCRWLPIFPLHVHLSQLLGKSSCLLCWLSFLWAVGICTACHRSGAKRLCLINSVLKHAIRGGTDSTGFICHVSSFGWIAWLLDGKLRGCVRNPLCPKPGKKRKGN